MLFLLRLICALHDILHHTHAQVVVDQDVLTKASAELTIPEAGAIAENTLQYSVRSMLWALQAPEILKASDGALLCCAVSSSVSGMLKSVCVCV